MHQKSFQRQLAKKDHVVPGKCGLPRWSMTCGVLCYIYINIIANMCIHIYMHACMHCMCIYIYIHRCVYIIYIYMYLRKYLYTEDAYNCNTDPLSCLLGCAPLAEVSLLRGSSARKGGGSGPSGDQITTKGFMELYIDMVYNIWYIVQYMVYGT